VGVKSSIQSCIGRILLLSSFAWALNVHAMASKLSFRKAPPPSVRKVTERDIEKWTKKAKAGDSRVQHNLGVSYEKGLVVEQDLELARKWYVKASQKGYAPSFYNLGMLYFNASKSSSVKGDPILEGAYLINAAENIEKAAVAGLKVAQYNLAIFYFQGKGVDQNQTAAMYWLHKAAEQGCVDAQFNLGIMYLDGLGTFCFPEKAAQYLKQAAEQGEDGQAQHYLSCLYELGVGVAKNPEKALEWCRKAAEQGYLPAQKDFEEYYGKLR